MDRDDSPDPSPPGERALAVLGDRTGKKYDLRPRLGGGDVPPLGGSDVGTPATPDEEPDEKQDLGVAGRPLGFTLPGSPSGSPRVPSQPVPPPALRTQEHGFGTAFSPRFSREPHAQAASSTDPNGDLLDSLTALSTAAYGRLGAVAQAAVIRYAQVILAGIQGFVFSGFPDPASAAPKFQACCLQEWRRLLDAANMAGHPTSLLHAIQDSLEQQRPPSMRVDALRVAFGDLLAYRLGGLPLAAVLFRSSTDAASPPDSWVDPKTAPDDWRARAARSSRDVTLTQRDLATREQLMGSIAAKLGPFGGETSAQLFNRQRTPTLWLGFYNAFLAALETYSVDPSSPIATVLLVKCLRGDAHRRYEMLKRSTQNVTPNLTHADVHDDFRRHYGKDASLRIAREYSASTLHDAAPDAFFEYWDRLHSLARLYGCSPGTAGAGYPQALLFLRLPTAFREWIQERDDFSLAQCTESHLRALVTVYHQRLSPDASSFAALRPPPTRGDHDGGRGRGRRGRGRGGGGGSTRDRRSEGGPSRPNLWGHPGTRPATRKDCNTAANNFNPGSSYLRSSTPCELCRGTSAGKNAAGHSYATCPNASSSTLLSERREVVRKRLLYFVDNASTAAEQPGKP